MRRIFLYSTITIFYLLTPICFVQITRTGVGLIFDATKGSGENYEKDLAIEQHAKNQTSLLYLWETGLFLFPISATGLLIFRKRLIKNK